MALAAAVEEKVAEVAVVPDQETQEDVSTRLSFSNFCTKFQRFLYLFYSDGIRATDAAAGLDLGMLDAEAGVAHLGAGAEATARGGLVAAGLTMDGVMDAVTGALLPKLKTTRKLRRT